MTRRAGLPRFSALSVRRGDAGHRKACATPSESLGKPPLRSRMRPVGGRRKVLTMHRIAGNFPPTRRAAYAISMSHDQRSLVLGRVLINESRVGGGAPMPALGATPDVQQTRAGCPLIAISGHPATRVRSPKYSKNGLYGKPSMNPRSWA